MSGPQKILSFLSQMSLIYVPLQIATKCNLLSVFHLHDDSFSVHVLMKNSIVSMERALSLLGAETPTSTRLFTNNEKLSLPQGMRAFYAVRRTAR